MKKRGSSNCTQAEHIEALCRIYKAAKYSGDEMLANAASSQLHEYGVNVDDLRTQKDPSLTETKYGKK
jgi:hypothetical protein